MVDSAHKLREKKRDIQRGRERDSQREREKKRGRERESAGGRWGSDGDDSLERERREADYYSRQRQIKREREREGRGTKKRTEIAQQVRGVLALWSIQIAQQG